MAKNKDVHSNQISYRIGYRRGRTAAIKAACKWLEAKNEMCQFELEMIFGSNFIKEFEKYLKK